MDTAINEHHQSVVTDDQRIGHQTSYAHCPQRRVELSKPDELTRLQTEPHKVGYISSTNAYVVRIVHISDTHGIHDSLLIPDGDVLIHSGDFFNCDDVQSFEAQMQQLDKFFAELRHEIKIFVAGNHELKLNGRPVDEIQSHLSHAIYLQDSSVVVKGLLIYGSPWTGERTSPAYAFTTPYPELGKRRWSSIPQKTDILVTHSPPYKILDHQGALGSKALRKTVLEDVRPLAHLFGHAHCNAVVCEHSGILFSNASQCHYATPAVIDVYVLPATN